MWTGTDTALWEFKHRLGWTLACSRGIVLLAQVAVQVCCGEAAEMAGEAQPHEQARVGVGWLRRLVVHDPRSRQLRPARRQP